MTAPVQKRAEVERRLEVNTGTDAVPVWTPVKGLNQKQLTIDGTIVDVSDYDSEGWDDKLKTFMSWGINIQGFEGFTGDEGSPIEDPGQDALRTRGLVTGSGAYANVRLYRKDTLKGFEGRVTVNWSGVGGGVKDASPFNATLEGSGKLTPITVTP